jgi:hypothetical protein
LTHTAVAAAPALDTVPPQSQPTARSLGAQAAAQILPPLPPPSSSSAATASATATAAVPTPQPSAAQASPSASTAGSTPVAAPPAARATPPVQASGTPVALADASTVTIPTRQQLQRSAAHQQPPKSRLELRREKFDEALASPHLDMGKLGSVPISSGEVG